MQQIIIRYQHHHLHTGTQSNFRPDLNIPATSSQNSQTNSSQATSNNNTNVNNNQPANSFTFTSTASPDSAQAVNSR